MNEDKLLVLQGRACTLVLFGCRRFDLLLLLYYRIRVVGVSYYITIVVHTTQLLLSITIYPHTKQLNMIWLVYCVTELVLLVLFLLLLCWLNSFVGVLLVFVFFCIFLFFFCFYANV